MGGCSSAAGGCASQPLSGLTLPADSTAERGVWKLLIPVRSAGQDAVAVRCAVVRGACGCHLSGLRGGEANAVSDVLSGPNPGFACGSVTAQQRGHCLCNSCGEAKAPNSQS